MDKPEKKTVIKNYGGVNVGKINGQNVAIGNNANQVISYSSKTDLQKEVIAELEKIHTQVKSANMDILTMNDLLSNLNMALAKAREEKPQKEPILNRLKVMLDTVNSLGAAVQAAPLIANMIATVIEKVTHF
jgi:hypothetical protein